MHSIAIIAWRLRGVAQLVAYVLWEHGVAGSNPVTSTMKKDCPERVLHERTVFFCFTKNFDYAKMTVISCVGVVGGRKNE